MPSECGASSYLYAYRNLLDRLALLRLGLAASTEDLMMGLLSLRAFAEQQRFVKGGRPAIRAAFWAANRDFDRVK